MVQAVVYHHTIRLPCRSAQQELAPSSANPRLVSRFAPCGHMESCSSRILATRTCETRKTERDHGERGGEESRAVVPASACLPPACHLPTLPTCQTVLASLSSVPQFRRTRQPGIINTCIMCLLSRSRDMACGAAGPPLPLATRSATAYIHMQVHITPCLPRIIVKCDVHSNLCKEKLLA